QYSLPDATQLITLPLTSDRMNIYQGNAHLKSPATWSSSIKWRLPLKRRDSYLYQNLSYTNYINRIVDTYRYEEGVYTNKPDNVNGTWNLSINTGGDQPFKIANLDVSFNYDLDNKYRRMKNFASDGITEQPLQIDNNELENAAGIRFYSRYKKVSGRIYLGATWRKPLNGRADMGYRDTWDFQGAFRFAAHLPAGIDLDTECSFKKRQGYSNNELNKLMCDWDMGLSKSILKDKITLKLQAIDILRQYKSVAYIINERGVRETRAISLPSYLLFSATYAFNKNPKKR
ncbi:MAG: outer membrane beta-barrel family protein, partial [Bacteroidaceae bacterium]|nr:outer membrane beta-barrel family protein [Bacteroidaceae bacterium]